MAKRRIECSKTCSDSKHQATPSHCEGDVSNAVKHCLDTYLTDSLLVAQDLEIIFSRFGTITSCDIIRDSKTGDSLCYAFLGFDTDAAAEDAYFKMNNVLIDDRRIKVGRMPAHSADHPQSTGLLNG